MKRNLGNINNQSGENVKRVRNNDPWIQEVILVVGYTSMLPQYLGKDGLLAMCSTNSDMLKIMRGHVERLLRFFVKRVEFPGDQFHHSLLFQPRHLRVSDDIWNRPSELKELPEGIQSITIGWGNSVFPAFPRSVREINSEHAMKLPPLPENLEVLRVTGGDVVPQKLPKGLRVLKLPYDSQSLLGNLPTGLEELDVTEVYECYLLNLPKGLRKLYMGYISPQSIRFPESLRVLVVWSFNEEPITSLPDGLKVLVFTGCHDHKIPLPRSLEVLVVGLNYVHPIDDVPPNLWSVTVGQFFMEDPKCIESLCVLYSMGFRVFKHEGKYSRRWSFVRRYPGIKI